MRFDFAPIRPSPHRFAGLKIIAEIRKTLHLDRAVIFVTRFGLLTAGHNTRRSWSRQVGSKVRLMPEKTAQLVRRNVYLPRYSYRALRLILYNNLTLNV